jgi:DNA-binding GntR family transcriptional regulator
VAEHQAVLVALERGDVDAAVDGLVRHWLGGIEVVARWLKTT